MFDVNYDAVRTMIQQFRVWTSNLRFLWHAFAHSYSYSSGDLANDRWLFGVDE